MLFDMKCQKIIIIQKIKKNGLMRLFKIVVDRVLCSIRGVTFGLANCPFAFPSNLSVGAGVSSRVRTLLIENNVSIGSSCSFGGLGTIKLSSGVVLNRNVHIDSSLYVSIGKNSLVAPDCYLVDSNHIFRGSGPLVSSDTSSAEIVVGANVWIGRGATILCGVTIGNNSVIGAGAVVTKSIPSGVIAAGVPAKIIRRMAE